MVSSLLGIDWACRLLCASEVNPAGIRVSKAHWRSARHLGDMSEMCPKDLKDILDKAPKAKVIVFCGGLPGPDPTRYTTSREVVGVESTKALTHLLDIMAWTVELLHT